jgi:lysophospholipase L1-like esterase
MIFLIYLYFILTVSVSGYKKFEIIAVGDSVTWGTFSSNHTTKSYPPQLEKMLNAEFKQKKSIFENRRNPIVVKNFGLPSKTLADFSKEADTMNK